MSGTPVLVLYAPIWNPDPGHMPTPMAPVDSRVLKIVLVYMYKDLVFRLLLLLFGTYKVLLHSLQPCTSIYLRGTGQRRRSTDALVTQDQNRDGEATSRSGEPAPHNNVL